MNLPSDWSIWRDPQVANRFTGIRRSAILGADAQIDTMQRLIGCVPAQRLRVLDLGCGDGVLLKAVVDRFAVDHAVALDGSAAMLEKAQARFEGLGVLGNLVEYVEADFNDPRWTEVLPCVEFEAVVSGFAIHHSENRRKRELYKEIFGLLTPGGVFVNVEHVASATPLGERLFDQAAVENLITVRKSFGEELSFDEELERFQTRPDRAANILAPVETQLQWLREMGYQDVDCFWKHFELAVLAGFRPGG